MTPEPEAVVLPLSLISPGKQAKIESRTENLGQQIFSASRQGIWNRNFWYSKLMELSTSDVRVKTQLFRFVDVLPMLRDFSQKKEHLLEYLAPPAGVTSWPWILRLVTTCLQIPLLDRLIVGFADFQVRKMATNFILGYSAQEALPKILRSREKHKIGFTLDILGEGVYSIAEADHYLARYVELIDELSKASADWKLIEPLDYSALGPIPPVNISIKTSAIDCQMDPMAREASLARLIARIQPLLETAVQKDIFVNFDMEQYALKDLTRELFKRLLMIPALKNYRHFGIVVQAYLKSSFADVEDWITFAKARKIPFSIRLVKGAYWDYETIIADQNGWPSPVFEHKNQTDANYENCAKALLSAHPFIEVALGSHNIRSLANSIAFADEIGLPRNAYEIQMLYGMADPFKQALVKLGLRVREYDPVGNLIPGLSYLVRRLLENSSNDSFLKQSFLDKTEIHHLLKNPSSSPESR